MWLKMLYRAELLIYYSIMALNYIIWKIGKLWIQSLWLIILYVRLFIITLYFLSQYILLKYYCIIQYSLLKQLSQKLALFNRGFITRPESWSRHISKIHILIHAHFYYAHTHYIYIYLYESNSCRRSTLHRFFL